MAPRIRQDQPARGIYGPNEQRSGGRHLLTVVHGLLLVSLLIVSLFPLWQLVKNSLSTTADMVQNPLSLLPNPVVWSNFPTAWNQVHIGLALWNTILVAVGCVAVQLLVGTTGGYVLGVLRPPGYKIVEGLVLATLFVPAVVTLVPSFLVVVHPPWGGTLMNSMWAVWLPAGVSSFNVLLISRFFAGLSREIIEAAEVDGAGPIRLFLSIVLPMSRPILVVVTIFGLVGSMQAYLWPMLVLNDPATQPLAVSLPGLQTFAEPPVYMAALVVAAALPIAAFLTFHRSFLSGEGLAGALKG